MQVRAEQKNCRQSPRKVRLLANQIKDLSLEQAFVQLSLMERKGSLVLLKVLRQAVANAVNNHQLNVKDLTIEKVLVKAGPIYKRMRPVSRGRAHSILKRTCHVEVVLQTVNIAPQSDGSSSKVQESVSQKTEVQTKKIKEKIETQKKTTSIVKKTDFNKSKTSNKPKVSSEQLTKIKQGKVKQSVRENVSTSKMYRRKAGTGN